MIFILGGYGAHEMSVVWVSYVNRNDLTDHHVKDHEQEQNLFGEKFDYQQLMVSS